MRTVSAHPSPAPVRSEATRQRLLAAACELFGTRGYDGVSLRDIEDRSGVNRGLIAYHFGAKDDLWKAAVDFYFTEYVEEMKAQREVLGDLDPGTQARVTIRNFVRLSARRPHLARLMLHENLNPTWRLDWIVKRYLKPIQKLERELNPGFSTVPGTAGFRYALIGACTMPFMAAPEMKRMHGVDPFDDAFIDEFVEMITRIFLR